MASIWSRLKVTAYASQWFSGSRNHIPELLLSTTGDKVWFPGWSKLRPWISWPATRESYKVQLSVPGYSYGSHTLQRGLYTKWARRTNSSSPRSVANGIQLVCYPQRHDFHEGWPISGNPKAYVHNTGALLPGC